MSLPAWLAHEWPALARGLAGRGLHHGLLLAAPAGYGKRSLAEALVAAALCTERDPEGAACGACRGCRLLASGSHPDLVRVGLELRDDGRLRQDIVVDQLRVLTRRLALSSQFGGWQVALVDPADRMNANAANALLKTLEEPARDTLLVLVADDASRLPATILSRCLRVAIPRPDAAAAQRWLQQQGVDAATARTALAASLGNPGRALQWVREDALALREACARELAELGAGRRTAASLAGRWAADRPELRLWFAAVHALDGARRAAGQAGDLTARAEIPKLANWYGRVNQARALLATTLRPELVLLEVLQAWPGGAAVPRSR